MIVYKKRPILYGTDSVEVTNNLDIISYSEIIEDPVERSLIDINSSVLYNLNHGKMITTLSLLDGATLPVVGLDDMEYPTFDNHGIVLNLQGYPGSVNIRNSQITNNMAFIPDVYPSKMSTEDEVEDLSAFINSETG